MIATYKGRVYHIECRLYGTSNQSGKVSLGAATIDGGLYLTSWLQIGSSTNRTMEQALEAAHQIAETYGLTEISTDNKDAPRSTTQLEDELTRIKEHLDEIHAVAAEERINREADSAQIRRLIADITRQQHAGFCRIDKRIDVEHDDIHAHETRMHHG